jgi:hypothetical protein
MLIILIMGLGISFNKHGSSLDELFDISAPYFTLVKFESQGSTQTSKNALKRLACLHI